MGIYSRHIFPRLLDWSLGNAMIQDQRRVALAPLRAHVLEIGFGTGLNLPAFPESVTRLTAIDSKRMLPRRVAARMNEASIEVELLIHDAGNKLPFPDKAFDGVVTTFTLCSIEEVGSGLSEIRRVLKDAGQYVFLEHGRSNVPRIASKQDFFNPIQKLIGCGCNMNRSIDQLIENAGFELVKLDRYRMPNTPRVLGEMYRGFARKDMRSDRAQ
jgi:ubiquinone/menaquinone biosynthesis C-methylase UbiE